MKQSNFRFAFSIRAVLAVLGLITMFLAAGCQSTQTVYGAVVSPPTGLIEVEGANQDHLRAAVRDLASGGGWVVDHDGEIGLENPASGDGATRGHYRFHRRSGGEAVVQSLHESGRPLIVLIDGDGDTRAELTRQLAERITRSIPAAQQTTSDTQSGARVTDAAAH